MEGNRIMERYKPKVLLAAILSMVFLGTAAMVNGNAISIASDGDGDGIDDLVEERNSRVLELSDEISSNDKLQIESHLEHSTQYNENNDSMEISFKNSTGLEIEISYNQNTAVDAEFELEFSIGFESLINYTDDNSNGKFDNSTVDSEVDFTMLNSFTIAYAAVTIGGVSGYKIIASATNINFTVIAYILQNYTLVNGSVVTPTEIMFDIVMGDLSSGTNDYALKLKAQTSADSGSSDPYEYEAQTEDESHGHVSGEDGIHCRNSTSSLYGAFTWNQTASVDGVEHQVNMTLEDGSGPDDTFVYLCYEHGSEIVHDPKVLVEGIENALPGSGVPPPSVPGYDVVVIMVITTIVSALIDRSIKKTRR
jgi:hypothetical protein